MKTPRLVALALAASALVAPAAAGAQAAPGDSVTGSLATNLDRDAITWNIDAFSGPSGETPSGTLDAVTTVFGTVRFQVVCLQVTGNRAVIGGSLEPGPTPGSGVVRAYLIVIDEPGDAQDRILNQIFVNGPAGPATCAAFDAQTQGTPQPAVSGSVVVADANPRPMTKKQCKHNGWRQYGFKNQGRCIRYVKRLKLTSAAQCRDGGWRRYAFRNKQRCITYVQRHPR